MNKLNINCRVLNDKTTGFQRYLSELIFRFPSEYTTISPRVIDHVMIAHLWEQFILPLRLHDNDVLFSPCNTGPIFISNQIVTIHDVVPLDRPEWFSKSKSKLYQYLIPRLAKRVLRIITISEFSKQRLLAHVSINENKIIVIPNGVDNKFSPHKICDFSTMHAKIKLPCKRYVLSVGTLEPRKNIPRLLKAWECVVDQLPSDVWLVLTGKQDHGELFAKVSGLNSLPPRVHLTGHVTDEHLPVLYAGAMVFVFPSLYEGFGLPPLEAMASGVPVLTGNLTSLPEVVGDAGMMVDPTSINDLASGLYKLVHDEDLRNKFIVKGLARASEFSWNITAQKTWSVLQEVAR